MPATEVFFLIFKYIASHVRPKSEISSSQGGYNKDEHGHGHKFSVTKKIKS